MKRGMILFISSLVLLLWIPLSSADGSWTIELVAGQNTTIGTVDVTISGDTLTATYQATAPGWCMSTTHFYASNVAPDKSAPGQFQYKHEGLDCVTSDVFTVPTPEGDVFVAAHADTHFDPNNVDDNSEDPDDFTGITNLVATSGSDSYLVANVDGSITGSFAAWCIDLEHIIFTGQEYTANVYDSYESPVEIVDIYENLDLINYIINQDYSSFATTYDVQVAIWLLIDDQLPNGITDAALAIVDDALANGEGFVPGCGQILGVILEPIEDNAQHLILEVPAPCIPDAPEGNARSETAWAIANWGIAFKTGWGMYFQLVDAPDEPPAPQEPPVTEEPPATQEPPTNEHGNRARNDEAPGQDSSNQAPGNRSDEAPGQQNKSNNSNKGNGNNKNGN